MKYKPPLPREHGAWAMLATPLLLGWLLAPVWHVRVIILFIASLSFFLLRHPLAVLVKRWGRQNKDWTYMWQWAGIYGGITIFSGGWLLLFHQLWWLIPAALVGGIMLAFHLWLVSQRQDMTVIGELVAILGLAMGAPVAYYVASKQLDSPALMLWLINFLYFGGTVFYIKLKVRQQPRLPCPDSLVERLIEAKLSLAYQAIVLILIAGLVMGQLISPFGLLVFLPATLKMVWGAWQWQDKKSLNLKRLGMIELVHTMIFTVLVMVA
jgi:hypothetical protein